MDSAGDTHDFLGDDAIIRVVLDGIPIGESFELCLGQPSMESQSDDDLCVGNALDQYRECIMEWQRPGQIGDCDGDMVFTGPTCQGPGRVWCRTHSAAKVMRKGR